MRRVLRLIGTWLIALALIVALVDLTHSVERGQVLVTALGAQWQVLDPASLAALDDFLHSRMFGAMLLPLVEQILALPAALVLLLPGALLAFVGRSRNREFYTRP